MSPRLTTDHPGPHCLPCENTAAHYDSPCHLGEVSSPGPPRPIPVHLGPSARWSPRGHLSSPLLTLGPRRGGLTLLPSLVTLLFTLLHPLSPSSAFTLHPSPPSFTLLHSSPSFALLHSSPSPPLLVRGGDGGGCGGGSGAGGGGDGGGEGGGSHAEEGRGAGVPDERHGESRHRGGPDKSNQ